MRRALFALLLLVAPMLHADCGNMPLDLQLEDPACRADAWERLYNHDDWTGRPEIWSQLSCMARNAALPNNDRASAISLFSSYKRTAELDDLLQTMVAGSDPELADLAAATMLDPYDLERDDDALRPYLKSDNRALRERAALLLAPRDSDATAIMFAIAKDSSHSPAMRGAAIRAISLSEQNVPLLLELLDRRYWFFGAVGAHWDVHSLAFVVEELGYSKDPAVRARLEALRVEILELPFDQRDYVEWCLDNALERMSNKP